MDREDRKYIEDGLLSCALNEDVKEIVSIDDSNLNDYIQEYIYPMSLDEILSYLDVEYTDEVERGPSFILPNGKFLSVGRNYKDWDPDEWLIHDYVLLDICDKVFEDKIGYDNLDKDYSYSDDMAEVFTDNYGVIRINTGEFESENRFYCVLPERALKKPTASQYDSLRKFFDYGFEKGQKEVLIFFGVQSAREHTYSLVENTSDEIIKKIMRYYGTGVLVEKNYAMPDKLYNIDKETAYWPDDAEDYIYWSSESDKWAEDYAKSYKVKMSPKDFLDLTTEHGADSLKSGDRVGGIELKQFDADYFNQEKHQNMFLQIAFRDENNPYRAQVVGHEGRHRMFALMQAGIKSVDVELRCDVYNTNYKKYHPLEHEWFQLVGQFNHNVIVQVYNPIPMSWKNHKAIRPNLTDESLVEYLEVVGENRDEFPVYATDDVYKLKALLRRQDKAYRIYNDNGTYYFQDALGNKTHYDMLTVALEYGYLADSELRVGGDDGDVTSGVVDTDNDEGYMVFIPKNYSGRPYWYTSLGDDGYDSCKVYDFGIMYVRDSYAYDNDLFDILGTPERTIWYDGYNEVSVEDKYGNSKDFCTDDLDELNDVLYKDLKESVETEVARNLGTSNEPIKGPSYILQDGTFLKIWNADVDIKKMSGSDSRSGKAMHLDVDGYIQKYINPKAYAYFYLNNDCIRVNEGNEEYICLPKNKPNQKQYDSLLKWLNFYFFDRKHDRLKVMDYYGSYANSKEYYLDTTMPEDIIKKIKMYYVTGELLESDITAQKMQENVQEDKTSTNLSDEPVKGPSFITPEGKFLRPLGDTHYSILQGDFSKYKHVADFCNDTGCIRVNDGTMIEWEIYITLSEKEPTEKQYEAGADREVGGKGEVRPALS